MTQNTHSVAELCRDRQVTLDDLIEQSGLEGARI